MDVDATRKILLAARGGPFAELALRLACNVAEQNDGQVTLLHVSRYMHDGDEYYLEEEMEESAYALLGRNSKSYNRITRRQVANQDVQEAIIHEAQNHDLILLGATATVSSSRAGTVLQNPFGPVARAVFAQQSEEERRPGVILVRAVAPRDFYFSRLQRRKQQIQIRASSDQYISELVDKWFA